MPARSPHWTANRPAEARSSRIRRLADLPVGAVGRVVDVGAAEGDAAVLKSLGICGGQRVRLIRTGDPLVVYVVGARIGLSARLASVVLVETEVALKGVE